MNLVKANLEAYLPALAELADGRDFPWTKIDKLFQKKLDERTTASQGQSMEVEASLYDLIISLKKQETRAVGLLHFIERLAEELLNRLSLVEKQLISGNMKQLLLSFDSKYLNFLGELAVLNKLLKFSAYRLTAVERPLSNQKSIDFMLQNEETGRHVLVEVMSIHLNESRVVTDAEAIRKFLTHKLTKKVASKLTDLVDAPEFQLIPVIWGSCQAVQVYSDFFKAHALALPNVLEPVSLLNYHDGAGNYDCRFGSLSTLFKQ
jgi:hypothetical protein